MRYRVVLTLCIRLTAYLGASFLPDNEVMFISLHLFQFGNHRYFVPIDRVTPDFLDNFVTHRY